MPKWMSLDEAYEMGFSKGRDAINSERLEKIENDDDCDAMAEDILDDLDEENKEPYSDETATNKEIKEFESGFIDGFFEGYKEHAGGANDNPSDGDDDEEDDDVEEVK